MEAALTRQEAASLARTDSGARVAPPLSTAFGGIFLLLPQLDELPLPEATRGWPNTDEAAAISLVRWLVLLKCCGRENSERAFYDPLLRDLLLIPPTLSPQALRTWQARLKPEHLQSFFAALCEWQWSRGAIEGKEQLLAVATRSGASAPLVLIDAARGLWLRIDTYTAARSRKNLSIRCALRWTCLLKRKACFTATLLSFRCCVKNFPRLNVIDLSDHAIEPAEAETRGIDAISRAWTSCRTIWNFCGLPGAPENRSPARSGFEHCRPAPAARVCLALARLCRIESAVPFAQFPRVCRQYGRRSRAPRRRASDGRRCT